MGSTQKYPCPALYSAVDWNKKCIFVKKPRNKIAKKRKNLKICSFQNTLIKKKTSN